MLSRKSVLNRSEELTSYHSFNTYVQKCRQVKILPLSKRLDLNDLILFHKIVNELCSQKLPDYLTKYSGNSRLRSCHHDSLSYVASIVQDHNNGSLLNKSFFYRTHSLWNTIPFEIRDHSCPVTFKSALKDHFWQELLSNELDNSHTEFYVSDNG